MFLNACLKSNAPEKKNLEKSPTSKDKNVDKKCHLMVLFLSTCSGATSPWNDSKLSTKNINCTQ